MQHADAPRADTTEPVHPEPAHPESRERFTDPVPDRPPTPDEEAAAERAAASVDVDEVAEHYEEMAERGAGVRGEGEIEPA